jgi:uncharacterized membrane protein (UPF0136 family)
MSGRIVGWLDQRENSRSSEKTGNCHSNRTRADLISWALIVLFGASVVLLHQRTADFMGSDVFYADAAQSLLHHGFYGVNGTRETTQPPGLSAILAALYAVFGYSYAISVGAMGVFATLGFLAAYAFLRRRAPSVVAAAICIVLLSSPVYFAWATRFVYACFPYFFTTMMALLAGEEYDQTTTVRSCVIWGTVFTAAVAASLLIATSTAALLGAMAVVVVITALQDRRLARARLQKFFPVLLVGISVLGLWMHRKPAPLEWPLPGYPASYLQQLKVKNGNYPELGMAKWSDIPERVTGNFLAESDILAQIVLRHGVNPTKVAVVIVPVLLVAIGWAYSVWKSGGMQLVDWYFAGYQFIYLLWPWKMDARFFLPIVPLACFYIWQGGKGIIVALREKPRVAGIIWFPAALLLGISGAHWIYTHWAAGYGDFPDELLIPLWLISAGCALWMACSGRSIFCTEAFSRVGTWFEQPLTRGRVSPLRLVRYAGYLIVAGVTLIGIVIEARMARENLSIKDPGNAEMTGAGEISASDVEAGVWLRSHTAPDSVVMASNWPTVYHYAERKLIWFAPISDPGTLFEGIMKHGVDYVVVVKHASPYYLPDDDYCFDRLLAGHAGNFRLVLQRANLRIFSVDKDVDAGASGPQSLLTTGDWQRSPLC